MPRHTFHCCTHTHYNLITHKFMLCDFSTHTYTQYIHTHIHTHTNTLHTCTCICATILHSLIHTHSRKVMHIRTLMHSKCDRNKVQEHTLLRQRAGMEDMHLLAIQLTNNSMIAVHKLAQTTTHAYTSDMHRLDTHHMLTHTYKDTHKHTYTRTPIVTWACSWL